MSARAGARTVAGQGPTGTGNGDPGPQGPAGPAGLTWQGAYNPATAYAVRDGVLSGGSAWIAVAASTGVTPGTDGSKWSQLAAKGADGANGAAGTAGSNGAQGARGLTWRGAWSSVTTYLTDDAVQRNGSAYIAIAGSTNADPATDATKWALLAAKGTDGAAGSTGAAGTNGTNGTNGVNGASPFTFTRQGTIAVLAGTARCYNDTGRTLTISKVRASVGTAPAGAAILVDVNRNGTSIFTTQANRPSIAAAGNTATGVPDVTTIADGQYFTVDIDQVGSSTAGADLVVTVVTS